MDKQAIFLDDSDYTFFMEIIAEQRKKYKQIKFLEFALLPNHFHFVFKNLAYGFYISRFFSRVEGQYSRYFCMKYGISE
ncbi:MAG: hypothetical protein GXP45_01040 [bacterium]|nr:hypothetical protein [bacterium]